jgi:hypothetical protein
MLTKREKQKKEKSSTDMDEESLDINVCEVFTDNHKEIVRNNDDNSMSITNNLFHFEQTNEPDKCYLKNYSKNKYDEVWWYHKYLQHPEITRMEATLRQNLTWPNIRKDVEC